MRELTNLDFGLAKKANIDVSDKVFYEIDQDPFKLYGIYFDKNNNRYCRMPQEIADKVNEGVALRASHTSGGRLRFSTNSKTITIIVKNNIPIYYSHVTLSNIMGFSLCQNKDDKEEFLGLATPSLPDDVEFIGKFDLSGEMCNYTLYFPLYNGVNDIIIGFDKGAKINYGKEYEPILPILYYGSSITQGGFSSRPDTNYQSKICKENNVDFINLGFSGSAFAENVIVDYLSGIESSLFVMDYDHNAPNPEHLEKTHYSLYKAYRDKHPDTPILMITKPDFYGKPEEGLMRFNIIRNTYKKAKASGDKNVYMIDGRTFFKDEWDICTVDRCHPNDLGFYKMAKIIGAKINKILNIKK